MKFAAVNWTSALVGIVATIAVSGCHFPKSGSSTTRDSNDVATRPVAFAKISEDIEREILGDIVDAIHQSGAEVVISPNSDVEPSQESKVLPTSPSKSVTSNASDELEGLALLDDPPIDESRIHRAERMAFLIPDRNNGPALSRVVACRFRAVCSAAYGDPCPNYLDAMERRIRASRTTACNNNGGQMVFGRDPQLDEHSRLPYQDPVIGGGINVFSIDRFVETACFFFGDVYTALRNANAYTRTMQVQRSWLSGGGLRSTCDQGSMVETQYAQ